LPIAKVALTQSFIDRGGYPSGAGTIEKGRMNRNVSTIGSRMLEESEAPAWKTRPPDR
jgi:hypothetical protein